MNFNGVVELGIYILNRIQELTIAVAIDLIPLRYSVSLAGVLGLVGGIGMKELVNLSSLFLTAVIGLSIFGHIPTLYMIA